MKSNPPEIVTINGHDLVCPICSNQTFWRSKAQLNTAVASLFNLDWANRSATYFVCSECTHLSWFYGE